MFFIIDNQRGILFYHIWQLPCRARVAQSHNLFSHPPFRMEGFEHVNVFFFPLIDRFTSTIHSNQTLDASIKYVA